MLHNRHALAVGLASFRVSLAVILFLFLAFYEAGLIVNNQPTALAAPVSGLTDLELCRWTVFGGGSREKLLLSMVNRGRKPGRLVTPENRTWSTCGSVSECLQQVVTAAPVNISRCAQAPIRDVEVLLSWRTTIISEFRRDPRLCNFLEVVDAEEEFFTFGMGWYFADVNISAPNVTAHLASWTRRRQDINAALRRGRMTHAISQVTAREVGLEVPCPPAEIRLSADTLCVPVIVLLVWGGVSALTVYKVYEHANDTAAAAPEEAVAEMDDQEQRAVDLPTSELRRRGRSAQPVVNEAANHRVPDALQLQVAEVEKGSDEGISGASRGGRGSG